MALAIKLPVTQSPNMVEEDEEDVGDSPLLSVGESLTLLHSLRQSRNRWLTEMFPKFSAKKGKQQEAIQRPPHTAKVLGRCNVEIGPHIFPDTVFFEVQYISMSTQAATVTQPRETSYYKSGHSYGTPSTYNHYQPSQQVPKPVQPQPALRTPDSHIDPALRAGTSSTPYPGLDLGAVVPDAVVNQVTKESASNPEFNSLLALAVSGTATPEQYKMLGNMIQSLPGNSSAANISTAPVPSSAQLSSSKMQSFPTIPSSTSTGSFNFPSILPPAPSAQTGSSYTYGSSIPATYAQLTAAQPSAAQPFDIVIEFKEKAQERWLIPRSVVAYESVPGRDGRKDSMDVTLSALVPFEEQRAKDTSRNSVEKKPTRIRIISAPYLLADTLARWVGLEAHAPAAKENFTQTIKHEQPRVYLKHNIRGGTLSAQLQAAANPYAMKSIKPLAGNENSKPKRAARARKGTADGTLSTPTRRKGSQNKSNLSGICRSCARPGSIVVGADLYCGTCLPGSSADAAIIVRALPLPDIIGENQS